MMTVRSAVDNHDDGVFVGNINERSGRNCVGRNGAYKVFDEMPSGNFLRQEGTVREYYDLFVPFANRAGWNDLWSVSMFIWGLHPEIKKNVTLFKPKTLYDAYCLAINEEAVRAIKKPKQEGSVK